jgi:hypothetical protein
LTPAATSRAASDWTMNKARETVARSAVRARERPMRASASRDARARRLVFTRDVDRKLNLIMMCVRIKFLWNQCTRSTACTRLWSTLYGLGYLILSSYMSYDPPEAEL